MEASLFFIFLSANEAKLNQGFVKWFEKTLLGLEPKLSANVKNLRNYSSVKYGSESKLDILGGIW